MTVRILGIPGSLRRRSYNRRLLEAAAELAPDDVRVDLLGIRDLPPFDQDAEGTAEAPASVHRLREAIRDADALLIASPEYNYSVPGVLKNAIDWASRPPGESVLRGKPVAIMGASAGQFGTIRAQAHWRDIFLGTGSDLVTSPEVYVAGAPDRFDGAGRLVDETSRGFVRQLVENLAERARSRPGAARSGAATR